MTSTTCEDLPDLSRQAREYHGGSWTMNEHTVWFCTAVSLVLLVLLVSLVSLVSLDQLIRYPWRIARDTVAMKTTSDIR
jgi:hypothetical protein